VQYWLFKCQHTIDLMDCFKMQLEVKAGGDVWKRRRGVLAAKRRSVTLSAAGSAAWPVSERHIVTFYLGFKDDTATDSRPTVNFRVLPLVF
jgi:hypothetical protein